MKTKRGQCRCGAILQFSEGPEGYKMRCPDCGAVVRLQRHRPNKKKSRPVAQTSLPVIEQNPLALIEEMAEVDAASRAEAPVPPPLPNREQNEVEVLDIVEMEPWDAPPPSSGVGTLLLAVFGGSFFVIGLIVGAIWYFNR